MTRFALLLALLPAFAHSQVMTFTADTTAGDEQVTTTLNWTTTPTAFDCVASGDWSGSKGSAGSETITVNDTSTFNLECSWVGGGNAVLSWTPPTTNTNGTPLNDLDHYSIYYGRTSGGPYTEQVDVPAPAATHTIDFLPGGTWYFVSTAVNERGVESDYSNEGSKTLPDGESATESIGITVNPKPSAPGGLGVQ